jgi:hypothetical protein
MPDADYFRRQADALEKLARSLPDPVSARRFQNMAADFRTRAKELDEEDDSMPAYMAGERGSSDGEMDRD